MTLVAEKAFKQTEVEVDKPFRADTNVKQTSILPKSKRVGLEEKGNKTGPMQPLYQKRNKWGTNECSMDLVTWPALVSFASYAIVISCPPFSRSLSTCKVFSPFFSVAMRPENCRRVSKASPKKAAVLLLPRPFSFAELSTGNHGYFEAEMGKKKRASERESGRN